MLSVSPLIRALRCYTSLPPATASLSRSLVSIQPLLVLSVSVSPVFSLSVSVIHFSSSFFLLLLLLSFFLPLGLSSWLSSTLGPSLWFSLYLPVFLFSFRSRLPPLTLVFWVGSSSPVAFSLSSPALAFFFPLSSLPVSCSLSLYLFLISFGLPSSLLSSFFHLSPSGSLFSCSCFLPLGLSLLSGFLFVSLFFLSPFYSLVFLRAQSFSVYSFRPFFSRGSLLSFMLAVLLGSHPSSQSRGSLSLLFDLCRFRLLLSEELAGRGIKNWSRVWHLNLLQLLSGYSDRYQLPRCTPQLFLALPFFLVHASCGFRVYGFFVCVRVLLLRGRCCLSSS